MRKTANVFFTILAMLGVVLILGEAGAFDCKVAWEEISGYLWTSFALSSFGGIVCAVLYRIDEEAGDE